ncbi:MAG: protein kinase [Actinomycetota bacterium]|nr:protein kinase [Actinomycetota bacterium]
MVIGTLLGNRYRLDRKLASGGMGTVFLATDERLGKRVAIKTLNEELAENPQFVDRFQREARAVVALSHPNIANVSDYGEENGTHYIAMEYIKGRDLARILRTEGPLGPERAVAICSEICEALAHAHEAGVVHRDIKPANVIIDDKDRVKVTDFGIARAAGDTTFTATGSVIGTVQYIAPEQATGTKVGPEADLYSLGIVLYELLTGSVPFTADSPIATAMRHVTDDVPPPSGLNPEVVLGLDEVVGQATAKDPDHRFSGAAEMGAALRDCLHSAHTDTLGGAVPAPAATVAATPSPPPEDATEVETGSTVWPIPGDRYDPARLGRIVIATFVVLALVAAAAFLWRLARNADETADRVDGGTSSPTPTATSLAPAGISVPKVIGLRFTKTARLVSKAGVEVRTVTDTSRRPWRGHRSATPSGDEAENGTGGYPRGQRGAGSTGRRPRDRDQAPEAAGATRASRFSGVPRIPMSRRSGHIKEVT